MCLAISSKIDPGGLKNNQINGKDLLRTLNSDEILSRFYFVRGPSLHPHFLV